MNRRRVGATLLFVGVLIGLSVEANNPIEFGFIGVIMSIAGLSLITSD